MVDSPTTYSTTCMGRQKYVAHKIMEQLPLLRSEFRCTPLGRIVNLGCVYSDRVPMLVPDITDAFESIFKVMLVTNCVPLVSSPCDFTPLSYATECSVAIIQEDCRAEYDMASGPQCREIFMQRVLQFEDVPAAIQDIRGHTAQELPMEGFVPKMDGGALEIWFLTEASSSASWYRDESVLSSLMDGLPSCFPVHDRS